MTPRGAAPLVTMRHEGMRPSSAVWVNFGSFKEPAWWRWAHSQHEPELLVRPEDPIDRLDLRCLVGLRVVLFFEFWTELAGRLYDRLQEVAESIVVLTPDDSIECGWVWRKDGQQVPIISPNQGRAC